MSKRIIRTVVNRKWAPLEIWNYYGGFTVELKIGFIDKGPEFDPDDVAWFVAQMALHNGVLQANDPQAELPWEITIAWQQGKLRGAGLLKLDRLWNPKKARFERVGQTPEAEPEGYTFLNVAQLALMELTNALSAEEQAALAEPPTDAEEVVKRMNTLCTMLKERPWCPSCPWYRDQDLDSSGSELAEELVEINFLDGSRLFITPVGFTLEQPAWAAAEDEPLPETLKAGSMRSDTPCWGSA